MEKYCFINGKIIPTSNALLEVCDIGLLRSYGIFEVLRTYSLKPFLLEKHLDRLESSARFLGLNIPLNREEISETMDKLIDRFQGKEISLRIVLTGGRTNDGMDFNPESPTFIIIAEEFKSPEKLVYEKGVALFPVEHQRIFPGIKTLNYLFPIKIKKEADGKGFFDLLYLSKGKVLESSTSNFFIIKNDTLVTPAKDVLMGITRGFVIDIAKKEFKIEERDIAVEEINTADEAFITATNKEIIPVTRIGDTAIGSGLIGKKTKELIKLFKNNVN